MADQKTITSAGFWRTQPELRDINTSRLFQFRAGKRWLPRLLLSLLAVWLFIAWVSFGITVIRFYSPLPFWDYWDTLPRFELLLQHNIAGALWAQHNEHRMVFPNLVFMADYAFSAGREILPIVLSFLLYFGTWLLLSKALLYATGYTWPGITAALTMGIVLAWQGAALAVASPFLAQWSILLAFAALALFLLAEVPGAKRPSAVLALAVFAAVVCTYSAANGLFLWPILLVSAWVLQLSRSHIALLAISAIAFTGAYFAGFHFSRESDAGSLWQHPLYAIAFTAAYLGMPFTVLRPYLGVVIGLASVATATASAAWAIKRRKLDSRTGIVLFGMYALVLMTAAMTALGRMNPKDPSMQAATAQRYILLPLVGHACLLAILIWLLVEKHAQVWSAAVVLFAVGLFLLDRSPEIQRWNDFSKQLFLKTQIFALAAEAGIDDPELSAFVLPDPVQVADGLRIMQRAHLSVFASGAAEWIGKPARSRMRSVSESPEPGAVADIYPIPSGLIVTGWTESPRRVWVGQKIVFVNETGTVIGFGRKLPGGVPPALSSLDNPTSLAWVGFVNSQIPIRSFSAYAVTGHGRALTKVGKSVQTPSVRGLPTPPASPALTEAWQAQGWIKNGHTPVPLHDPPIGVNYYASWDSSDSSTGTVRSSVFAVPPDHCIVLSSANGPFTGPLSEVLMNADTGETVASAPLNGLTAGWHYWAMDIPSSVKHLQIIASDKGTGWGEWLAIGEPQVCR